MFCPLALQSSGKATILRGRGVMGISPMVGEGIWRPVHGQTGLTLKEMEWQQRLSGLRVGTHCVFSPSCAWLGQAQWTQRVEHSRSHQRQRVQGTGDAGRPCGTKEAKRKNVGQRPTSAEPCSMTREVKRMQRFEVAEGWLPPAVHIGHCQTSREASVAKQSRSSHPGKVISLHRVYLPYHDSSPST